MSIQRLVGIILIVGGVVLFIVGWNATDSFTNQMSNFFTGHFTDKTIWTMIGGAVAFLVGLSMTTVGGRNATV